MGFSRGSWRCGTKNCGGDAVLALNATVSTPGDRKTRLQKTASTLRLCQHCIDALRKGKVPAELAVQLTAAINYVQGVR